MNPSASNTPAAAADPVQRAASLAAIVEALRSASNVLVVAHKNPDGDCLGSAIALTLALRSVGKQASAYCPGPLLAHLTAFPDIELVSTTVPNGREWDTSAVVDCSDLSRVAERFAPPGHVLNIDHHISNTLFGDVNWVDVPASSTGEMIYHLCGEMGIAITQPMAVALYVAIMSDTGSFRYSNTRPETFDVAGRLVALGADPSELARMYYESAGVQSVRLKAMALAAMKLEMNGRLVWSELTARQIEENGGPSNEPEGMSSALRGMQGVEVGLMFTETPQGEVRISLRSHGGVDVARLAGQLGGGGHAQAAGGQVPGPLAEARERTLEIVRKALSV